MRNRSVSPRSSEGLNRKGQNVQLLTCLGRVGITFLAVLTFLLSAFTQTKDNDVTLNVAPAAHLKVTLSTDRAVYGVSDKIRVTVTLENASQKSFYLDPSLRLIYTDTASSLAIDVFDEEGNELQHSGLVADAFGVPDNVIEIVKWHYLVLDPGNFYGLKTELPTDWYEMLEKPGRYKLVAVYSNNMLPWLNDQHKQELSRLPYPLWSGRAVSEGVWIEVKE